MESPRSACRETQRLAVASCDRGDGRLAASAGKSTMVMGAHILPSIAGMNGNVALKSEVRPLPEPETLSDAQLDRELLTLRLDVHADKIRALALLEEYRRRQRMCELN
jgi:hypothetical protein